MCYAEALSADVEMSLEILQLTLGTQWASIRASELCLHFARPFGITSIHYFDTTTLAPIARNDIVLELTDNVGRICIHTKEVGRSFDDGKVFSGEFR